MHRRSPSPRRPRRGARAHAVLAALLAAVVLAGCSSDESTGGTATAARGGAEAKSQDGGRGGEDEGSAVGAAVPGVQALIRTVSLTVRVKDVNAAVEAAARAATTAGGVVATSRVDMAGHAEDSVAQLVLRVPNDDLDEVTASLRGLGALLRSDGTTQDVTAEVADVDSRVETQRRSLARVRALLDDATALADVVTLESELAKRESDLEALQARQRALADRTSLATVTLDLVGTASAAPVEQDREGFVAGLSAGWDAFSGATVVLLTIAGALLPFLLAAALVALVVLAVLRTVRRRTRLSTPQAPPASAA